MSELNSNLQNILEQGLPHTITIRNEYAAFLEHREDQFVRTLSLVRVGLVLREADCETSQNATFWGTGIF